MQSKRIQTLFDLVVVAGIFVASTLLAALVMKGLGALVPDIAQGRLTFAVYTVQFALALVGAYCYYRWGRAGRKRGDGDDRVSLSILRFSWHSMPLAMLGVVLTFAASVVLEPLLNLFPDSYFDQIGRMVGRGWWAIALSVVVAPVLEELFFRGLVLEQTRRGLRAWQAILLTALVFSLAHSPCWPQVINALVMGVMLGYIYVVSRSVWPVIAVHVVNNAIAYLLLETTGSQGDGGMRQLIGNDNIYWWTYAASAIFLLISLILMAIKAEKNENMKK